MSLTLMLSLLTALCDPAGGGAQGGAWTTAGDTAVVTMNTNDTIRQAAGSDVERSAGRRVWRVRQHMDSVLDRRDSQARHDTAYMARAPKGLRLRVSLNASGSTFHVEGSNASGNYNSTLEAQNKYTMSFSASYRGVTAGLAVNPAKLTGKNKDIEFNINAYGNHLGADVIFQSANTFSGNVTTDAGTTDMPAELVRLNLLTVNAYYVFSGRRFSYPAAFSQSWMQKKSCGSWMLGTSVIGGNIRVSHSETLGNPTQRLSLAYLGLGVGYAYNFVLRKGWLLHLSTLPELVVATRSRMTIDGERAKMPYRFPNVIVVGRIAAVKHFGRYFAGFNTVVNAFKIGDKESLWLGYVKWRARFFVGVRI